MTKAFESIKAGLKQAIAHQQNKPNTVVLHNVANRYIYQTDVLTHNARPDPVSVLSVSHDTVYAMTIHKSQGSGFDTVTLVLPDYDVPVLTRELFYTGLTRGRARLAIYSEPNVLGRTVERRVTRVSGLAERVSLVRPTKAFPENRVHNARPNLA